MTKFDSYIYCQDGRIVSIWLLKFDTDKTKNEAINISHTQLKNDTKLTVFEGNIHEYLFKQGFSWIVWVNDADHLEFSRVEILLPPYKKRNGISMGVIN